MKGWWEWPGSNRHLPWGGMKKKAGWSWLFVAYDMEVFSHCSAFGLYFLLVRHSQISRLI